MQGTKSDEAIICRDIRASKSFEARQPEAPDFLDNYIHSELPKGTTSSTHTQHGKAGAQGGADAVTDIYTESSVIMSTSKAYISERLINASCSNHHGFQPKFAFPKLPTKRRIIYTQT